MTVGIGEILFYDMSYLGLPESLKSEFLTWIVIDGIDNRKVQYNEAVLSL